MTLLLLLLTPRLMPERVQLLVWMWLLRSMLMPVLRLLLRLSLIWVTCGAGATPSRAKNPEGPLARSGEHNIGELVLLYEAGRSTRSGARSGCCWCCCCCWRECCRCGDEAVVHARASEESAAPSRKHICKALRACSGELNCCG